MSKIVETPLPGIGSRFDITDASGASVSVIVHTSGRRDFLMYDEDDPDMCVRTVSMDEDASRDLAQILGEDEKESRPVEQQTIGGLSIDWIDVENPCDVAEAMIGLPRGSMPVAVLREATLMPIPEDLPDLREGDKVVALTPVAATSPDDPRGG